MSISRWGLRRVGPGVSGPIDLLLSLAEVREALDAACLAGEWLDAYLLCCAAVQVVEDGLHHSGSFADRVAGLTRRSDRSGARQAAWASARVADGSAAVARRRAVRTGLLDRRDELEELSIRLARLATDPGTSDEGVAGRVRAVVADQPFYRPLDPHVIRLPSCFVSFDQHPDDVVALIDRFVERHPDLSQPILVVGVRTSGCYLAPLAVVHLRAKGYADVTLMSLRPGERLDARQRARVAAAAASGWTLLLDDPPVSGTAVRTTAELLEGCGVRRDAVVLLMGPADAVGALPPTLQPYEQVVLPPDEWRIARQLAPGPLAELVGGALAPGWQLVDLVADPTILPAGTPPWTFREHRRCSAVVTLAHPESGETSCVGIIAEGCGVGLFGRHTLAIADALPRWAPRPLSAADGILLSAVGLADTGERGAGPSPAVLAHYLADRAHALALPTDRALSLRGRQAAWEVAAELAADALGRGGAALRVPVVEPLVRRILARSDPSVVDGRLDPWSWLPSGKEGMPAKLSTAGGAFSHRDLWSYDAAFDVRGSRGDDPAGVGGARFEAEVRQEYEAITQRPLTPERWLLYGLVHAWDRRRRGIDSAAEAPAIIAQALSAYVAEAVPPRGAAGASAWCAIDLDGVVETETGIGSSPGRSSALALRSLAAHGYGVVPATGRALDDVIGRCAAWGWPGGVAEYGTCLYLREAEEVVDLRTGAEAAVIDRLREALNALGIETDDRFTRIVRARRPGGGPPDPTALRQLLEDQGLIRAITVVPGDSQTDLVPSAHTKATGVVALLARLDPDRSTHARPLAMAVGDGPADQPLLGLAEHPFVPRHAAVVLDHDPDGRPTCRTRAAYQAGLAEAVQATIGHRPGGCRACAWRPTPAGRAMVDLLSIREAGPRRVPYRLARFVRSAAWAILRPGSLTRAAP